MTDAFLATVETFDPILNVADVKPLIVELDGTDHPTVSAAPLAGITPESGDLVLVVTARNALDDEAVSRYYDASEATGRIVHVVKPQGGVFIFTGDYKFVGDLIFDGDVKITGDLNVEGDSELEGDLIVGGDAEIEGTLDVTGDVTLMANLNVTGNTVITGNASCANLTVAGLQTSAPGPLPLTGALLVTGALTVNGALTAASAVIGGVNFATHTHAVTTAPGVTGPPT